MKSARVFLVILALALAGCAAAQPGAVPATRPAETPAVPTAQAAASPTRVVPTAAAASPAAAVGEVVLANTRWQLVSLGPAGAPAPVLPAVAVTLEFKGDTQVGGSGGCNSYGGVYRVQGNMLTFGQLVSTLRACADDNIMQQEKRYFDALQAAGQFEMTGDRLTVWYDNRQGVLNFAALGAAPAFPALTLTPTEPPERVQFDPGSTSAQRTSLLPSGVGVKQYVLAAKAGQAMTIEVTSDGVPLTLVVESPSGARFGSDAAPVPAGGYRAAQTVALPETGDYRVTLAKAEHTPSTNYEVDFTIR